MNSKNNNIFGGGSIDEACYWEIVMFLPVGKSMVEFGSGRISELFAERYKLYSIEHSQNWIGKYKTNYVHAPLKQYSYLPDKWYDIDILIKEIPKRVDLILIDGPPVGRESPMARWGFFAHMNTLFDLSETILVFDDTHRKGDLSQMIKVAKILGREYKEYQFSKKKFGIIG